MPPRGIAGQVKAGTVHTFQSFGFKPVATTLMRTSFGPGFLKLAVSYVRTRIEGAPGQALTGCQPGGAILQAWASRG